MRQAAADHRERGKNMEFVQQSRILNPNGTSMQEVESKIHTWDFDRGLPFLGFECLYAFL